MSTNPYATPKAAVADETVVNAGNFVADGRGVGAGRGWGWIAAAWELYKRAVGLWIAMIVVLVIMLSVLSFIPFLGALAQVLFWPVIVAGLMIGCRELEQGRELEFGHLFAGFREQLGSLVGIGALALAATVAIILVVALVMGASVLAVIGDPEAVTEGGLVLLLAGLIAAALYLPVAMATWFAPGLVVFHQFGAWAAVQASFRGCLKNIVPFLVYGVVLFPLAIVASIPLGLGWLALGPVIAISVYTAYRDIYFT